jgi:predicted ribosomally synthesized peptide with nif11-like leader
MKMSKENLQHFLEMISQNKEMLDKANNLAVKSTDALIEYAKELGFELTENDLMQYGKALLEQSNELSDDELEHAAAGAPGTPPVFMAVGVLFLGRAIY